MIEGYNNYNDNLVKCDCNHLTNGPIHQILEVSRGCEALRETVSLWLVCGGQWLVQMCSATLLSDYPKGSHHKVWNE